MMNFEEIESKKEPHQTNKIRKIDIFGSFVRGEERKEYLSKLLGRKIDLVRKQAIREELIQKIYQMR